MNTQRSEQGLRNLKLLIQQASTKYANEFVWQDIQLTNEFKNAYADYLCKNGYDIEFFDHSAVITTSQNRYIFVPNQWFVIASYPVDVFVELNYYKDCFKEITGYLGEQLTPYTKKLRDEASPNDMQAFMSAADVVLRSRFIPEKIEDAKKKLWRFVTDYSWWSGQKTIDRTDFYISVMLNMLNLVNVSQGYVADIVYNYGNDFYLRTLVADQEAFTIDMTCNIIRDAENTPSKVSSEHEPLPVKEFPAQSRPATTAGGTTRIKISANNQREIKVKP